MFVLFLTVLNNGPEDKVHCRNEKHRYTCVQTK